jgi:hypothetical protein
MQAARMDLDGDGAPRRELPARWLGMTWTLRKPYEKWVVDSESCAV